VRAAVMDAVRKQTGAGIDIVNDGEMSKPSYATYIKDRLDGFGGSGNTFVYQDLEQFPNLAARVFGDPGRSRRKTPACNGPIRVRDGNAAKIDVQNLAAALAGAGSRHAFMSAASPGLVSLFFRNEHYPSQETYLFAIADAMREEYEAIAGAGFVLQLDCPDLAMGRHIKYHDADLKAFRKAAQLNIEALNHAVANIPQEQLRMHVCWGNYEGPHDLDVELDQIIPFLRRAKVGGFVLPFANPRHAHEYRYLNDLIGKDQIIVAGVIDSTTNFVEHPEVIAERLENVAETIGDPHRVMAGSDCGFETIAGRGRVAEDVVWAKFKSMAEGAKLASERLF